MIWAAVDLLEGRCAQLQGGDPRTARYVEEPVEAARRWADEGVDGLHVIDLNAALGSGENGALLEEILREVEIPVQIGGGVRDARAITHWLDVGAERIIVGTRAIREPEWLSRMAERFPSRLVLALDARGDEIAIEGWTRRSGRKVLDAARGAEDLGLAALLYTNVSIEGSLQGIDPRPIRALCDRTRMPVLVSGGIRTAEDVRMAYQLGAAGVVVGTAIYAGTLRLAELAEIPKRGAWR